MHIPSGTTQLTLSTRGESGRPRPQEDLALGPEFVSEYELGEVLGCGAMGMVCRAVQRSTARPVAIKFLKAVDGQFVARFVREGRALARISHPGVIRVYTTGEADAHPYLVTELLTGRTLRERLERERRIPWLEAVPIAIACLEGLAACHVAGIVHRDVKPENILFASDGAPKIADLGIAHDAADAQSLTATGAIVGTPRYMAPEQLMSGLSGPLSDVWAMAAVLFEMIAGCPRTAGSTIGIEPGSCGVAARNRLKLLQVAIQEGLHTITTTLALAEAGGFLPCGRS